MRVKRKDTKKRILESALKLFSEKGIRETTIKDIAKEVGITEGAIYRHFTSKDEIVRGLFGMYSEEFYDRLMLAFEEKTYRDKFYRAVEEFLSFCFENPEAFKYLDLFHYLRAEEVKEFKKLPKDAILKLLEEGRGVIKIRAELALAMFVGTLERVFLFTQAGLLEKYKDIKGEVADLLWKALTSQ
ncbi:transcriptional regulator, TetR family [Hydrogenobacter thermophilus TK-6]|uniref:Transcriptional regulator, TetR/AcrR family n=1 Tax=Hydrogenobacter thermophilus (strain DSM 6534 / IAM 12695 / TK-6) TaxID=608538 RepID=D3DHG8_HYDTT|nr:TetR/AcrR family transcriptional regulator [Hydrogenobacter thermophilus]ADO45207.1 transcriptional regulator, TetR family [Hydrogenobacter thermophilus TK-6]BAI69270.1 transcriptional regulator, TetR/AcrR family [Hydrogenobacter thermophilus TK-6]